MSGDPEYLALLDALLPRIIARSTEMIGEMRRLHVAKNAGYAGDSPDRWANFRGAEEIGVTAFEGCLIRLGDKRIRVTNLVANPANEQVGESVDDTLMDESAYALIAVCLRREAEAAGRPWSRAVTRNGEV